MEPMKASISVTIDKELAEWIKREVASKKGKYRNISHLVEQALIQYQESEKKQ